MFNALLKIIDILKKKSMNSKCNINPINWIRGKQWGWATLGSVSSFKTQQSKHWKFPVGHKKLGRESCKIQQRAIMQIYYVLNINL